MYVSETGYGRKTMTIAYIVLWTSWGDNP